MNILIELRSSCPAFKSTVMIIDLTKNKYYFKECPDKCKRYYVKGKDSFQRRDLPQPIFDFHVDAENQKSGRSNSKDYYPNKSFKPSLNRVVDSRNVGVYHDDYQEVHWNLPIEVKEKCAKNIPWTHLNPESLEHLNWT